MFKCLELTSGGGHLANLDSFVWSQGVRDVYYAKFNSVQISHCVQASCQAEKYGYLIILSERKRVVVVQQIAEDHPATLKYKHIKC